MTARVHERIHVPSLEGAQSHLHAPLPTTLGREAREVKRMDLFFLFFFWLIY
jgi:hypothetical protein